MPNAPRWPRRGAKGKASSLASSPRAWQRMLSGRRLDLLHPSPLDIEIEDIAHGLARTARWNGQTRGRHIFSVAQHALLVEALLEAHEFGASKELRLAALLHDAAEYVIGDLISPFKAMLSSDYKEAERRILAAVHQRFGLPASLPAALEKPIKHADRAAAFLEAVNLAGFSLAEARRYFPQPDAAAPIGDELLIPWSAAKATRRFLARFRKITGEAPGAS
ncbi:MAG: YfbR-like 5'-deoxynucleotidase [Hyphomicrobiales bacterium]